jgi:hypothetical protein
MLRCRSANNKKKNMATLKQLLTDARVAFENRDEYAHRFALERIAKAFPQYAPADPSRPAQTANVTFAPNIVACRLGSGVQGLRQCECECGQCSIRRTT